MFFAQWKSLKNCNCSGKFCRTLFQSKFRIEFLSIGIAVFAAIGLRSFAQDLTKEAKKNSIRLQVYGDENALEETKQTRAASDEAQKKSDVQVLQTPGMQTQVFYRGLPTDHTLSLLNGVPLNDSTAPTPLADFSILGRISKLQILPPSQSVIWGGQGLGGIFYFEQMPLNFFRASYGAPFQREWQGSANWSGSKGEIFGGEVSQKIERANVANQRNQKIDEDQDQFTSGSLLLQIPQKFYQSHILHQIEVRGLERTQDYDAIGNDGWPEEESRSVSSLKRKLVHYEGQSIHTSVHVSQSESQRWDSNFGESFGRQNTLRLQHTLGIGISQSLLFGGDFTQNQNQLDRDSYRDQKWGGFLQYSFAHAFQDFLEGNSGDGVSEWKIGLRREEFAWWTTPKNKLSNQNAGIFGIHNETNFSAGWGLDADFSSGQRFPSAYQLGSAFGNENLKPEQIQTGVLGVQKKFLENKMVARLEAFASEIQNAWDFDSVSSTYNNAQKQNYLGETFSISIKNWVYSATHMQANNGNGEPLPQRAKWKQNFGFHFEAASWEFNCDLAWMDQRKDVTGQKMSDFADLSTTIARSFFNTELEGAGAASEKKAGAQNEKSLQKILQTKRAKMGLQSRLMLPSRREIVFGYEPPQNTLQIFVMLQW